MITQSLSLNLFVKLGNVFYHIGSCRESLEENEIGAVGAIIAIDQKGNFGKAFETKKEVWATMKDGKLESLLEPTQ